MEYHPIRLKTRTQYIPQNLETTSTLALREKNFASIGKSTGKIIRFYPKPTASHEKIVYKSKSKSLVIDQQPIKIKVRTAEKPSNHTKYFDKLEVSCILPIKKSAKMRLSSATTSLNIGSNSRKFDFIQDVVSLNWSQIKKTADKNFVQKLIVNCSPKVEYSTNLCLCEYPCKWAARWIKWTKQPKSSLYNVLKQGTLPEAIDTQIKKDLQRTQPQNPSFQQFHILRKLQQILQTYCKYDKEIQYVQGMNIIASTILYHVKQPEKSFWILVDMMQRRQFRQIYLDGFKQLSKKHTKVINKLLETKVNDLYLYFNQYDVCIDPILVGWFLSLMLKVIPLQYGHLVIDDFISQGFIAIYRIIITYFIYLKEQLFLRQDASQILYRLSPTFPQQSDEWENILQTAKSIDITQNEIWQILKRQ